MHVVPDAAATAVAHTALLSLGALCSQDSSIAPRVRLHFQQSPRTAFTFSSSLT